MTYRDPNPRRGGLDGFVFAFVVLALLGYLGFAALQGQYGLVSLLGIEAQETALRQELASLRAERAVIENKTRRLSADSLDLELLDEQARKVLGLGLPEEILIP